MRSAAVAGCVVALLALPGCASIFYGKTKTGTFKGKLDVEWIAPNQFIYRPHATDPLVFEIDGRKVQPRAMYTDGGSIPRLFWSVPEFGPWDFAPGYIIHDWLFEQHHCKEGDWAAYSFERSAEILAEAIKTQMVKGGEPDPTVVWAIYEAVRTPIARGLWDKGTCKPPPPEIRPATNATEARAGQPIRIKTISFP